jgi:hypothetical protein
MATPIKANVHSRVPVLNRRGNKEKREGSFARVFLSTLFT